MKAPYVPHSATSRTAAKSIKPVASALRMAVLAFIRGRGWRGATDDEIQIELGMGGNTQRPRRRELEQASMVKDSGLRRLTVSGRAAVVWVAEGTLGCAQKYR